MPAQDLHRILWRQDYWAIDFLKVSNQISEKEIWNFAKLKDSDYQATFSKYARLKMLHCTRVLVDKAL